MLVQLGLARSAAAVPQSFTLDWSAPAECPTRVAIERAVDAVVGPAARSTAALSARGIVTHPNAEEYRLDLAVETEPGTWTARTLAGSTCASVSDAAALLIALSVRGEQEEPPPGEPIPAREPERQAHEAHEPSFASLAAALDSGATGALAPGLGVVFGASWALVRWEASIAYFPPRRRASQAQPSSARD